MADFLYKELSEKEREEIKVEAKKIMDSFGTKLESMKNLPEESSIERSGGFRIEEGVLCDSDFKNKILENAKNKNEDFIIAEKKSW